MKPNGDTLDIKPLQPGSDQTGIDAARDRLAKLPDPHQGSYMLPGETISLRRPSRPVQTASLPVSPAAIAQTHQAAGSAHHPASQSGRRAIPSPLKPVLSGLGAFVLLLLVFKSQILFSQLKYLTAKPQAATSTTQASEAITADPTITISKINVSAPVVYEKSISEAAIQKSLQNGVVHYGTSVVPGQPGNMVIVGHSSNDWWEPGNYKFVFVLLDKLVPGDQFSINYQSKKYAYRVSEVKVVEPTDLSVLAPTPGPTATLITCTPPGTSWKRLVVKANQISPEPNLSTAPIADQTGAGDEPIQLPGNAPSVTNQLGRAWQNITRGLSSIFHHQSQEVPTAAPTESSGGSLPAAN
jgi:LPXTG-site transpeptidase (sortase) family protein